MRKLFVHLCSDNKLYCTFILQNFGYYSKCCSAFSEWSTLSTERIIQSIPADHRLIHCYQLAATALRGCSWTGNHCLVWFIFKSELSSPRHFFGITYSFKVTRKRLNCSENAFWAISFSKFSGRGPPKPFGRGLRAFSVRGRPAPPTTSPWTVTQSCRKSMPMPPNRFHTVRQ